MSIAHNKIQFFLNGTLQIENTIKYCYRTKGTTQLHKQWKTAWTFWEVEVCHYDFKKKKNEAIKAKYPVLEIWWQFSGLAWVRTWTGSLRMKRRRRRKRRAGGETWARRTRARRWSKKNKKSTKGLTYIIVDSYEQKKMTIY